MSKQEKPALAHVRITMDTEQAKIVARLFRSLGKTVRVYRRNVRADGVLIALIVVIAREKEHVK